MDVSTAVDKRKSVRAFLDQPVDDQLLADLVEKAARAPSGGNVQPWRIYVVNGPAAERFKASVAGRDLERPAYDIYPRELGEPYRTSRWELGEQMYASIGIPREDKPARLRHVARNYELFGAPAAVFCFVDRQMGPPQWSDLGMFLQTLMLLAEEAGLGTCAQESWAMREQVVSEFVGAPSELRIFCAIALGYEDTAHPINNFRSPRLPLASWATFVE